MVLASQIPEWAGYALTAVLGGGLTTAIIAFIKAPTERDNLFVATATSLVKSVRAEMAAERDACAERIDELQTQNTAQAGEIETLQSQVNAMRGIMQAHGIGEGL